MKTTRQWDDLLAKEEERLTEKYGSDFLQEINYFNTLYTGGMLSFMKDKNLTLDYVLKIYDDKATKLKEELK